MSNVEVLDNGISAQIFDSYQKPTYCDGRDLSQIHFYTYLT